MIKRPRRVSLDLSGGTVRDAPADCMDVVPRGWDEMLDVMVITFHQLRCV